MTPTKIRYEVQDIGAPALFVQGSPVKPGQVLHLFPEQAEAYSFLKPLDPLPVVAAPPVKPKPKASPGPVAPPPRLKVLPGGGVSMGGNGVIVSKDRDTAAPESSPSVGNGSDTPA